MNFQQIRFNIKRNFRLSLNGLVASVRMLNANRRALPDFIIAGAQKAGTTSLYAYLVQHPNILPAYRKKEIHYWDRPDNYKKGPLWYRAHFPYLRELQTASAITGEKTPNYLENPEYIRKIKEDIPSLKLIILLRNPIGRTISNYFMLKKRGWEELSLMDALACEEERLADQRERRKFGTERAYKIRSIYAPSIRACLENFPPGQLLILDSNTFYQTPSLILKEVYGFLGVDSTHLPESNIHRNLGDYEGGDIPSEAMFYLRDYFRPYNQELYALLGRDFGWDISAG